MKQIFLPFWATVLLLSFLPGCKKDTGPQPDQHEYYQPVQIGNWFRYTIDSVYYDGNSNTPAGSVTYSLIESYDTDVPNAAGKLETRIKLERIDALPRRVVGFSYVQRFYNASKGEYTIERTDNGVRYLLFKAPVIVTDTFDRNGKNLLPPEIWSNFAVGVSGGGAGGNYDHTLRIVKEERADSLMIINDFELYAFNVGLFYKERTYITGRTDLPNWENIPVMQRIASGFSYKKVLVDKGTIQ
jgi:hypothetical protein